MTATQIIVLSIFAATYLALVIRYQWKLPIVIVACAVLLLWPGLMGPMQALAAINWNVIMLYFGMLFLTETLLLSNAPGVLAERLVPEGMPAVWAILIICTLSGFISIFVENVAAVLVVAPIALAVAKRLNLSPVPVLIGVAVASNLQGAATLIGDPPSMLLAGDRGMTFNDFFWYHGRPGIFFAVELGAVAATAVLAVLFRKVRGRAPAPERHRLHSAWPIVLLVALVVALAASSVLLKDWKLGMGIISLIAGAAASVWWLRNHSVRRFVRGAAKLDWGTGFFIIGVFIIVGSLVSNGLVEVFVGALSNLSGGNKLAAYSLLVWGSVLASAFIDNVPFVAAMLPVCAGLARTLGIPVELLAFGMMIGASIGGNITPIGASANIVAMGIAKRQGYEVTFGQFMRIGLPFTLAGTAAVYVFLWLVWR